MLKRIGILGFVLSIGAMLAPVSAFAQDRRAEQVEHRNDARVVEYRAPVRHDDWDRGRNIRREDRVVVRTVPSYYYGPAPVCGR